MHPNHLAFEFKSAQYNLVILQLYHLKLEAIEQRLAHLIQKTPHFFQETPILLDLQQLETIDQPNFLLLIQCLRKYRLIPVGIRGGTKHQQKAAIQAGLAVFSQTKFWLPLENKQQSIPSSTGSKLITQPVRSGQQVCSPRGDLIILASVSPGAELLADGNIHVYGRLQGRALAGINGNQEARIFCQILSAELVSIAGHYRVSEDLQKKSDKAPVCIYLQNQRLHIGNLYP